MKLTKCAVICCLALLFALSAGQAWGKARTFEYPPLSKFEIPNPTKVTLDNGMTVYLLEDHTLPRFNVSVVMNKCGDYLEPPYKLGLADMTGEVMRTGGTATMTGDAIDIELEGIGAYVETSIGTVSGSAGAGGLIEYKDKILAILADVMRNPVFDEDKIELARTNQKSAISRRNDDPFQITLREYRKLIFGADSPYARYPEYATIDAITRDDIVMFHQVVVQPNNMQLAVWGDFDSDEMLALIKKYFGDWPAGQTALPSPPDVEYTFRPSVNLVEKDDVTQSNVLIGHVGGKMGDPDYPATIVMNSVLGGSFGSRITDNVRSKKGYAYAAQASFTFNYDYPGFFYAYAATKLGSTVDAIRIMIDQIRSMQTVPPTEEEMRKAKDGWLNSFVFNFDSKGEVINRMMTYDYYGLPRDFLQQLKEAVENVTPQDVIDVAKRKLHPDDLQLMVVGKSSDFDEPLTVFGEVTELDVTIPTPQVEEFAASDEELVQGRAWLDKVVAAGGGIANYKKIENISTAAKVTITMPQGSMTIDVESIDVQPDKSVQVIKSPMGQQVEVFDGTSGWTSAAGQTQMSSADANEEQKKSMSRDIFRLFAKADNPDYQVAYKGEEEFAGITAVRLDFLTAIGAQFTLYVNPETNLPVGERHMGQTMMGPGEIVQVIKEHKKFGGVMMPTMIDQDSGGMGMEIEVVDITVNGEIDMSVFEKPEGI